METDTIEARHFILLSVALETITVQGALLRLVAFVDEMTTEAAGIGVLIGIFVADQGLHMIEVGAIEVGAPEHGTWTTRQTCRYLEEIQERCQMFS